MRRGQTLILFLLLSISVGVAMFPLACIVLASLAQIESRGNGYRVHREKLAGGNGAAVYASQRVFTTSLHAPGKSSRPTLDCVPVCQLTSWHLFPLFSHSLDLEQNSPSHEKKESKMERKSEWTSKVNFHPLGVLFPLERLLLVAFNLLSIAINTIRHEGREFTVHPLSNAMHRFANCERLLL